MGGIRLGVQVVPWLAIELNGAIIPISARDALEGSLSGLALHYGGGVLISPFEGAWTPHLVLGGGMYQLADGDLGSDGDWEIHTGLGFRGMIVDWMALRGEARIHFTDSFTGGLAPLLDVAVGVDFIPVRPPGAPEDSDGDGITDDRDECVDQVGVSDMNALAEGLGLGCPDTDRDGTVDRDDRCIIEPGPVRHKGCPDRDGDGIPDIDDACMEKPGLAEHKGCPPPQPDADKDGVPDDLDGCPDEPGPAKTEGCPDGDGDGIADMFDKCPKVPGVAEENGCLPKIIQRKFSGSVKGIQFESGSAVIKKASFKLLDEAAKVFQQYPTLRIEISGHTDNEGDAAFNMRLSEERAEAVRKYLIDKGIEGRRLVAIGYGQDRPVASNKSAGGRAQNRRIEFRILAGEE
jgi:outer membrane protein OmpA-like peptidoglycan-associated protein